jgi:hypothetical protein
MDIKFTESTRIAGKLTDVELHFTEADGVFAGLKLIGFSIWQRRTGTGRNVTFPARTYKVNGDARSFALLRPIGLPGESDPQGRIRDLILEAYAAHEAALEASPAAPVASIVTGGGQ